MLRDVCWIFPFSVLVAASSLLSAQSVPRSRMLVLGSLCGPGARSFGGFRHRGLLAERGSGWI